LLAASQRLFLNSVLVIEAGLTAAMGREGMTQALFPWEGAGVSVWMLLYATEP